MQSRQLWNTGPLYMCAVGCCEVADACGVPCRLSLSRLFIYLLTYLHQWYCELIGHSLNEFSSRTISSHFSESIVYFSESIVHRTRIPWADHGPSLWLMAQGLSPYYRHEY